MEEEYKLFLDMYDYGRFDWDMFEEGSYHFLNKLVVEENQHGGDGYIDVETVFKVGGRFFKTAYTLMGKDLDEEYDIENPYEVFPYETTVIKYR